MKTSRLLLIGTLIIAGMTGRLEAQKSNIVYETGYSFIDSVNYKASVSSIPRSIEPNLTDIARYFINKPYKEHTLEQGNTEKLTANLREFDCTTFVENCMAVLESTQVGYTSFATYLVQLRRIRYRDGKVDGYASRLHYMTDWIYENEKKGILVNISPRLGAENIDKPVNYMSTHPDFYKQLKGNEEAIGKIKEVEEQLNARRNYWVIPVSKIKDIQQEINDGDIILFATNVKGLDYSHMGIAYHRSGVLTFIHASSREKKVVIENKSLLNYCKSSRACTGITVLRLR